MNSITYWDRRGDFLLKPVIELPGELMKVDYIWVNCDQIAYSQDAKTILPS
jgi:hypothetical protein